MKQAPNSRSQPHSLEEQLPGRLIWRAADMPNFHKFIIKRRDTYLFFSSQE